MSNPLKTVITVFAAIILGYFAIKIVLGLVVGLLSLLLPVAIIGAIGYVVINSVSGKPMLGGRRRTLL